MHLTRIVTCFYTNHPINILSILIRVNCLSFTGDRWVHSTFKKYFGTKEKKKKKSLLQIFSPHPEKPKSGVLVKNLEFWLRKLSSRSKLALEKLLKGNVGL